MAYLFYVNMQKRGDGKVYSDLHKTDEKIYFEKEDAEKAISEMGDLAKFRHVVPLVAMTEEEYDAFSKSGEQPLDPPEFDDDYDPSSDFDRYTCTADKGDCNCEECRKAK